MHQAQTTMFRKYSPRRPGEARRRRALRRGQSIVVALLVLLLLGLAGALFVTIVARNLLNARHANRVLTADQYAKAGITFASAQLTNSLDGADWRPPLQFKLIVPPKETRELNRYTAAVLANSLSAPDPTDPDAKYLEAGFARYNTGAGRFLLRATYMPVLEKDAQGQFFDPVYGLDVNNVAIAPVSIPPGKYIKIESIGREGVIDTLDPTTFGNNRTSDRLQSYQVAYQPIGITDYARFETNPDNRSTTADMGVTSRYYAQDPDGSIITPGVFDFSSATLAGAALQPYPIITTYGAPDAYLVKTGAGASVGTLVPNPKAGSATAINNTTALAGGGSFHANMPVRFFGKNVVYLNDAGTDAPLYQDSMETVGDLLLNGYKAGTSIDNASVTAGQTGQIAALIMNPKDLATLKGNGANNTYIYPSNDPANFSTQLGRIRDGSSQNDVNGLPRSIQRIEPPLMNAVESATQLPRYKAIAMNAPPRGNLKLTSGTAYTPPTGDFTPSRYGYGRNIYIDNTQDIQPESTSIGGGSTLVDEWLNRTESGTGASKGNWNGNFYDPPGVSIILGQLIKPATASTAAVYGIRLVRGAGTPGFVGPDGNGNAGPVLDIPYSDLDTDATGIKSDNDVVIYLEGNARIHGVLSPNEGSASSPQFVPRHFTIVSNGTAYIEGNVLKGSADSSISILAHDYICVNTSQFLAGPSIPDPANGFQTAKSSGLLDYPGQSFLDLTDGLTLLQEFNFGLPDKNTANGSYNGSPLALYLSGAAGTSGSGGALANIDILDANGQSVLSTAPPFPAAPPLPVPFGSLTHTTIDLSGSANQFLNATGTDLFRLSVQKAPGAESDTATQDVELERAAILPMDIRVEAVLFAQTRSFFVIPGQWFNTAPDDTLDRFVPGGSRPDQQTPAGSVGSAAQMKAQNDQARFPFYGQPIDMKIIIDGSVSEAQPSDVANQTAWMLKWGWIPQFHGSAASAPGGTTAEISGHQIKDATGNPASKPAIGLQIIYNPQAGYPYNPGDTVNPGYYLRSDAYGRPLPFTPKLPVSTALLFAGQSSEPPLLQ